jgi:hypothetical protein
MNFYTKISPAFIFIYFIELAKSEPISLTNWIIKNLKVTLDKNRFFKKGKFLILKIFLVFKIAG